LAVFSHNGSAPALNRALSAKDAANAASWNHGIRLSELANLSHELRTPVQVMLGYLEILREDLAQEIGPHARRAIERLNVNAQDLARTAENLLDFAYARAGAELLRDEEIDVGDLVAEIAPALEALNFGHRLAVNYDLKHAPQRIRSLRKPLRSIVSNLAANAVKFTRDGSVTIVVRGLPSASQSALLEIEIIDTGPGIDPGCLEGAFATGSQSSTPSTRRSRGMGLGLAVVHRNLDTIGATLYVDTAPGRGSRFTVRVPLRPRIIVNGSAEGGDQNLV
jgi:two-component system capsular synthesis sensor histidine kinase RcsC